MKADTQTIDILLLGSGGREHALAAKLAASPRAGKLYIAPGNGGTASCGENVVLDDCDPAAVAAFAQSHGCGLVVIGPEAPLVAGVADAVRAAVLDSYPDCVLGDDPGTWFGTPELDDSGRVARIPVGSETLTGAQVRALFSLRSAAFSVAYSGGMFTFTVTGSGHGVGMSQYGANVMAIRGSGYADILAHYYPGTTLIRAEG